MKLTWIGHSCFKLEEGEYTVIFDPYGDTAVPGLKPVREKANLVLCSHEHRDHNARAGVEIIENGENPFKITEIPTFHDDAEGSLRGNNVIRVLDNGTYRAVHFGDIGCDLTEEQVHMLSDIDIAMIPVGGFYTVDAGLAKLILDKIHPGIIIPMHYRGEKFGYDVIDTVDTFLQLCDNVIIKKESSFEFQPGVKGLTLVLMPRNKM